MSSAPVEIQFDPKQEFQLDAIGAVVDLFDGLGLAATAHELPGMAGPGMLFTETGVANDLRLDPDVLARNRTAVQEYFSIPDELREETDSRPPTLIDATIEMETGTGKTYVYLRTMMELHRTYGLTKFIIVVPSVAIREGVQANLRLLRDHFAALYDGVQFDAFVYDSKNPTQVRGFSQANYPQILIINIDAFNKKATNLIHQTQDRMMGHAPVEFIRSTRPILFLDEPQNMGTKKARDAIASFEPSAIFRYSATHRAAPNLLYRLTPVDAYRLGLVKRIEVWSVVADQDHNQPHVRCVAINATSRGVSTRLEVDVSSGASTARKTITCRGLTDLQVESGRDVYAGWVVEEINASAERVDFTNGHSVHVGEQIGPDREALQRAQITTAIRDQLDRELDLRARAVQGQLAPTKALTLFFIDAVDHYWPPDGKFRTWFAEEYERLAALPRYRELELPPAEDVHNGYFARDRSGAAKDTSGRTQADNDAYELIMRDKQRLLSPDEPLRFIFSHSALREGWDNPNVFTICTLNESRSELRKRQEIGRGLRLPVSADGSRVTDPEVARLTVVANESYDEFATQLQAEIEEDVGVAFPSSSIRNARERRTVRLRKGYAENANLVELWERIKHRTRYRVSYDSEVLIEKAAGYLAESAPIPGIYIRTSKAALDIDDEGVSSTISAERAPEPVHREHPVPDLLGHLERHHHLSRHSIAQILFRSGRLGDVSRNPQHFLDVAGQAIESALNDVLVDGIVYERITTGPDAVFELRLFEDRELTAYLSSMVEVSKGPFHEVVFDSDVERQIALDLDARDDVKLFLKLPGWFTVPTPVGSYNPDWAVVKTDEGGLDRCYLVRESKAVLNLQELRPSERQKILYGQRHFDVLGVDFAWVNSASQI